MEARPGYVLQEGKEEWGTHCLKSSFVAAEEARRPLLPMALETYASQSPGKVHADVLSEARKACYKVPISSSSSSFSVLFLAQYKTYPTCILSRIFDTHKARDAFYACLEMESNKKPTEIATVGLLYPVECKNSRVEFEKHCRPSWVITR